MRETGHHSSTDGVSDRRENNRDCFRSILCSNGSGRTKRSDDVHFQVHEFLCQFDKPIGLSFCPPIFVCNVMPFTVAKFLQSLSEDFNERPGWLARLKNAHSIYFSGRSLRAYGKGPSDT